MTNLINLTINLETNSKEAITIWNDYSCSGNWCKWNKGDLKSCCYCNYIKAEVDLENRCPVIELEHLENQLLLREL
jgi:hypothetical protein